MKFYSRHWVKPEHLNPANTLFGGQLLAWIDEEAAIFAACQMRSERLVTKLISEVHFIASVKQGQVLEFGFTVKSMGRTSVTLSCLVRNKLTGQSVVAIDELVFVHVNEQGKPAAHGVQYSAA